MAKARKREQPFDFENATVGQPGPDGAPILRTFTTKRGVPAIETRTQDGLRNLTVPLCALRRKPVAQITAPPSTSEPTPRPARVAQMLALAHDLQEKLNAGVYRDRADAACQLGFTRARITQLLDLTLLAPDLQEIVLHLEAADGDEPVLERDLRRTTRHAGWSAQRRARATLSPSIKRGSSKETRIRTAQGSHDQASTQVNPAC